jgi:PAS domain S-box-containing protein
VTCHQDQGVTWLLYRDQTQLHEARARVEELRELATETSRQTEKEAEFLRELLRHTVETVQIGLVVQELGSGMIAYINDGFEKITGLHLLEVLGSSFETILERYPEAKKQLIEYSQLVAEHAKRGLPPPPAGHWEVDLPAGRKHLETYGRNIIVEGHQSQYLLLIIEDHTDRQKLQMQLVQSEKLAAIGQLAAGIAHEIRNPLATIYNALFDLSEILVDPGPDAAEDIEISMEEIKRVQDIINNLLDFARESERSSGRADLNEVLRSTLRLVQHDLTNKGIETRWELTEVPQVAMNSNALKQILINLITNAAQAMNRGGVLTIRTVYTDERSPLSESVPDASGDPKDSGEFRLDSPQSVLRRQSCITLEVADTGSGIPERILPNIFNPFFTTKAPGSGTGLGLSVVHSLVRDAGGAISVQSAVGKGTTFRIEIPRYASEDEFTG